jgi:hypothetical protein
VMKYFLVHIFYLFLPNVFLFAFLCILKGQLRKLWLFLFSFHIEFVWKLYKSNLMYY